MMKYKVYFSGFVYVYADTEEEAIEKCQDEDIVYQETEYESAGEVDDFSIVL